MVYFAIFGILINAIAWKKGFYTLPEEKKGTLTFLKFKHVFALFFIYITTSFFIPPFLVILPQFKRLPPMIALGWIQAITLGLSLLLIYLYAQTINHHGMKRLWKKSEKERPRILYD